MDYILLFFEFFKIGLFSIGGGLATLPFIYELMDKTHWFNLGDVSNMIAISESTPGPLGVNMATYVGNVSHGVLGGIVATLGLITPSVIIIIIVAQFLKKVKDAAIVQHVMYGLRHASTALIAVAMGSVMFVALFTPDQNLTAVLSGETKLMDALSAFDIRALILGIVLFIGIRKTKWHPVVFIAVAAVMGVILGF